MVTNEDSIQLNSTSALKSLAVRKYFQNVQFKFMRMDNFGLSLDDEGELKKDRGIFLDELFVTPHLSDRHLAPEQVINSESKAEPAWQNIIDILKQHPQSFILGDPGAGKTTLIHWLMLAFSYSSENTTKIALGDLVPFALILRELPLHDIKTFDDLWRAFTESNLELMEAFKQYPESFDVIKALLTSGQALILLDGLDEITNTATRKNLGMAVLEGMHAYPKCKFLISSRVVGFNQRDLFSLANNIDDELKIDFESEIEVKPTSLYSESLVNIQPVDSKSLLPAFYLAPFTYPQAQQFVSNWYKQYYPSHDGNHEQRVGELLTRMKKNDGLGRLSRTPVLLNMICFIHARRGRLPDGRAELYQRIAETYLVALDSARGITSCGEHQHNFDYADRSDWLSEIAYIMQCNRSENDEETAILISESKVREILTDKLIALDIPEAHIQSEINFLLRQFAERSGLFLPRGKDENIEERYGFSHLSFLEYFAAKAIKPKLDLGELNWKDLRAKTTCNWWQETFVLFFEQIEQTKLAEKYLSELFPEKRYSMNESYINSQLLLAAVVMDSGVKITTTKRKSKIKLLWNTYVKMRHYSFERNLLIQRLWQSEYDSLELGLIVIEKIQALDLSFVEINIRDLSFISGLSELQTLSLQNLQVRDLSILAKLRKLNSLALINSKDVEMSSLTSLKQLRALSLFNINNGDLSAMAGMSNLEYLFISNSNIDDLSPLAVLKQLKYLSFNHTEVSDLSPLEKLTQLKQLAFDKTPVSDVSVLAKLTKLEFLSFDETKVKDISALAGLTLLKLLSLDNTLVSDLSSLAKLTKLLHLSFDYTLVSDLSSLKRLTKLQHLSFDNTPVSDLSPLEKLTMLQSLSIDNTLVSDVSSLAGLSEMRRLYLTNTQVIDVSELAKLTELKITGFKS